MKDQRTARLRLALRTDAGLWLLLLDSDLGSPEGRQGSEEHGQRLTRQSISEENINDDRTICY
jgi:hypothetical protein